MTTASPPTFDGRVVAVTGAASGIGRAVAELVVEGGGRVVLLDRNPGPVAEAAEELGDGATAITLDVTSPDDVRAAFATIQADLGRLDGLVNAAGAMRYSLVEDHTDEELRQLLDTNLLGPILTSRAAIPLLRQAGGGDIVNLGSEVTEQYLPYGTVYAAAKGGLAVLSDRLGRELRPFGIRVSLVVVGFTNTGMAASITDREREASRAAIAESAYQRFSGTVGQDARWVAEAAVYPLTRPPGQVVGVIHARSMR